MESIEKLRTAARNMAKGRPLEEHEECNLLLVIANEIEREIAESYLKKPALEDGAINVDDWIESDYDEFKCVRQVEALIWDGDRWDYEFSDEDGDTRDCASLWDFYEYSKHVDKPDPIKELLEEFALDIRMERYEKVELTEQSINEYAARIREAVDAE